jgi:hypothetical protein
VNQQPAKRICPICTLELELVAFGVDRARPDGRNRACKVCVTEKARRRREGKRTTRIDGREKSGARHSKRSNVPATPRDLPAETEIGEVALLVLEALDHGGVSTQGELVSFVLEHSDRKCRSMPVKIRDRIGEALGELFTARLIATRGEAERRIYYRRRIA